MKIKIICVLAFVTALFSCSRFGSKNNKDGMRERIVCLSKQYNEIIFALGADSNLVAVDLTSTYPPEIKKLTTVGYHRALSAEAILAVNPTLIIHDNNIGPEHVVTQLKDLKVPIKVFSKHQETIEGTDSLIREMGVYFHREKMADSLCSKLDKDMKVALEKSKSYATTPKVLVIHFGQAHNIYLTMTKNSTAAKMIRWAGGQVTVDGDKGMVQLSAEVVAASNPDVILLTDFGYDRLGSLQKIKELPGIGGTKAAQNNRIYRVEEHDMVYLGPRTGKNVLVLQKLIHQ